MATDLRGRRILVTGGSRGIGLAVSQELARHGALVVIAARGRDGLRDALGELDGDGHHQVSLDVADAAAWRELMAQMDERGPLHGLVTAAGVLGPIGTIDAVSADEFCEAVAVDLVGTALALHHAIPRLRLTAGRAVTVSGGGGTAPLARYDAYAASKAGVVRLTENVALSAGIELNCVAPGFVATGLHEGTLVAGPEAAGVEYYRRTEEQLAQGGFPASEAAALVTFLLSKQAAGISGRLISAQWDPWRDAAFRARLRDDPSLARLRRIDDQFFTALPEG